MPNTAEDMITFIDVLNQGGARCIDFLLAAV